MRVLSVVNIKGQQEELCYFRTVLEVASALEGTACS